MTSRRAFLGATLAAAAGAAELITAAAGHPAPSERVTLGCVGLGRQGIGNLKSFHQDRAVRVVAVCDRTGSIWRRGVSCQCEVR